MTAPRDGVDAAALRQLDALSVDPSITLGELQAAAWELIATREPTPPAMSADEADALVDAFATAAHLLAQAELSDPGLDAGVARFFAARAAIIAALTGRATDAALAEAEARGRAPALSAADAAALVNDLIDCAAPYDIRSGWRERDHAALAAARADVIAALTGREGGAE